MRLNETLHNCVMAVAYRYPQYVVDIDEALLGNQSGKLHEETPLELLEQLQAFAPEILHVPALLECDTYRCELHVLDPSEEKPVILFHFPHVLATSPSLVSLPLA